MPKLKLVKTLLLPCNNKYEIYARNEYSNVEQIIHYKLRSCKNEQGQMECLRRNGLFMIHCFHYQMTAIMQVYQI